MSRIYLDHAATSPLRAEARDAMQEGQALWANPSSPHADGRRAKAALEDARERVKAALGWTGEVIFTSGASEALALGLGRAKAKRQIVSAVEHDAVFRAAPKAAIFSDDMVLGADVVLAVQQVNPETGTINPVSQMAKVVQATGALVLSDCSQSAGKMPLPDVDMAVISGHKFGGPIGVGALLVRDFKLLEPGGGHERGYRAGTENLPGVMGMAAALETDSWATTAQERAAFGEAFGQDMLTLGEQVDYIWPLVHPSISAQALVIRLDSLGFAISAGSACSSGTLKSSRVLAAFGVEDDLARRTIRVSLGWSTTSAELERFLEAWRGLR